MWRILCFALLLVPGLVLAKALTFPDTPAGRLAEQRLRAFNAGDAEALRSYQQAHEPELSVERELALREMTGGFELIRVSRDEVNRIELILREQYGDRVGTLELQVDPKQPERVTRFALRPMAQVPADLMPSRRSRDEAWHLLMNKATRLATQDQFAGVFASGRGGKLALVSYFGDADRAQGNPNSSSTRFRIGSMYKMFTAVAVLQLVEQGRLDLDAPLARYLPDYPNAELAKQVKIRHLLSHTGGTGDIFTDEYQAQRTEIREHSDYLKLFGERALAFVPGSREQYSNYGFVLLGAVIERVSGTSYHDLVRDRIFTPAGMRNTGAEPEDQIRAQLSIGYTQSAQGLIDNRNFLPWRGTAAGGGYTTAGDLLKFADALLSNRLISSKSLTAATRAQSASGLYGFGFQIGGAGEARHFGHAGGAEGMNGALRIYPASGEALVALSNLDPPAAETLVEYYGNRMPINATSRQKQGKQP
jgi:CubicO group peptidase (beta-lactamase class C family)